MSKNKDLGASSLRADRVTDAPHEAPAGLRPDGSVPTSAGPHSLLRALVEADIAREGRTSSTMVRAGLLADILDQHAELLEAAETVLAGLNERIDNADPTAVPLFAGIASLHDAIAKARGQ